MAPSGVGPRVAFLTSFFVVYRVKVIGGVDSEGFQRMLFRVGLGVRPEVAGSVAASSIFIKRIGSFWKRKRCRKR